MVLRFKILYRFGIPYYIYALTCLMPEKHLQSGIRIGLFRERCLKCHTILVPIEGFPYGVYASIFIIHCDLCMR